MKRLYPNGADQMILLRRELIFAADKDTGAVRNA